jgi:hypothetical protein
MLELSDSEKNDLSVLIGMLKEKKLMVADAVYTMEVLKSQIDAQEKSRVTALTNMQQTMTLITDKAKMIMQAHGVSETDMNLYSVDLNTASINKR